ncbi:HD domain-containing protein [Rhizobium leguminosarum]|uniref:HD domain-containing protein n=1 Tax=Rhizobium leguminosarum TaxID=384 RepID=UPI0015FB8BB3|nr:HD domain-containing protein [Rhizobium leguminosarum]MBA9032890.1 HD superfamily phosphodiesterase [Rhizobium leguminosarum]
MEVHTILTAAFAAALAVIACATSQAAGSQAGTLPAETVTNTMEEVSGIGVPHTQLAQDAARLVRETEGEFLFQHSTRVYFWGALAGKRKGLSFDLEFLYVAAMFHDFGLTESYGESHRRFEVDGANAARDFLRSHGIQEADTEKVWLAIALHTTNGISPNLFPIAALLAEGANMDLVGAGYDDFTAAERSAVEAAHPHPARFADDFMQALYDSLKHRPETTQGTGLADVMAYKDQSFRRRDFSGLMRTSHWARGR